jgi:imidazolonepropionase-like amidohydrolase
MAIIGGHLSYFGVQATGPEACRAAVRQLVKEGVDFIKITATGGSTRTSFRTRPSFNPDEMGAICDEAHKFGKHTVAHCASSQGMVNALNAGIDTIVHAVFKEPDDTNRYRPEIAERLAEQGVFVNPTLHANGRDRVEMLSAKERSESLTSDEKADIDRLRRDDAHMVECFALMRDAGVTLVCGSDSAWGSYTMGQFQREIEAHVGAGMSPMEAITSATGDSARSCRWDATVGTLEPGKQADVLVVDGDPTMNIDDLSRVADVFQDGQRVDRG